MASRNLLNTILWNLGLTYTATIISAAGGATGGGLATKVSIMQSADTPGMFNVTLAGNNSLAVGADPNSYTVADGMSYGNTEVEVMASDAEDLWASQMFYVRRNRAPVIRNTTAVGDTDNQNGGRYGTATSTPIVVGTAGDHVTLEIDTGDHFFFDDDDLMVSAEVDHPEYASVSVEGDVITLTGLKGTEGTTGTRILLRATDTGGLKSQQLAYALEVDTGPAVKAVPEDVTYTLEAAGVAVYVVDIERFFTLPSTGDEGTGTTYAAESSNISVATVTAGNLAHVTDGGGQGGAGVDLTINVESIGETTVKLTATEQEAGTNPRTPATGDARFGNPIQTASVEFTVNVVAE